LKTVSELEEKVQELEYSQKEIKVCKISGTLLKDQGLESQA
jgi:hypothetical protein